MPSSIIVPALAEEFALGTFAQAAATLAIRLVTTVAISSLINKNTQTPTSTGNTGGVVQLPPATTNKLPVVYGDAWVSPVIVDAKISTDQQYMWYVLAFSEATSGTVNFGEVYFDDKLLIFDPANPSEIRGWYVPADNTTVTGVAGDISMWFYNNGSNSLYTTHHCVDSGGHGSEQPTITSAIAVMQDLAIPSAQRWTTNNLMSDTVFAIMRIKYDNNHGVTGLGQIKAKISNSLKQPGAVLQDYLTNSRYGCGVDLANIDTASLAALDIYSGQTHQLINTLGQYDSGVRYTINGIIDTGQDCLSNLVTIADNADSWIQWNEAQGKWGVLINQSIVESGYSTATITSITSDQIIGGIQITPLDLNSTYNSVKVQFPNSYFVDPTTGAPVADRFLGQTDYRYYTLASNQRFINEPNNELNLNLPLCNNSLQATYIAYKRLFNSREDLTINFTMDYSGIQIDAGDIVKITHEWYGWTDKQFRITQVRESKASDGFLSVQLTAVSFDDRIYTTTNPHYFTPAKFSGISDPGYISQPSAPIIININTSTAQFTVEGIVPAQGNVIGMEFWYGPTADIINNNYTLYSTQYYSSGAIYPNGTVEQIITNNFPTGTYYWRTRAEGADTTSQFSDASSVLNWVSYGRAINGTQIDDNSISGSKVISGDPAQQGTSQSNGFFDSLGKVATLGLAAASAWGLYKKGFFDELPKLWDGNGAGNDAGQQPLTPKIWPLEEPKLAGVPVYKVGDTITLVGDSTPPIGDINNYANFDGYDVPPYDAGGGIITSDLGAPVDTGPVFKRV